MRDMGEQGFCGEEEWRMVNETNSNDTRSLLMTKGRRHPPAAPNTTLHGFFLFAVWKFYGTHALLPRHVMGASSPWLA